VGVHQPGRRHDDLRGLSELPDAYGAVVVLGATGQGARALGARR